MRVRIGIVGVSGYGGSELLRLCVGHPNFDVVYAAAASSAGQQLSQCYPSLAGQQLGETLIQRFVPEEVSGVDLLFTSLPSGESREPLARVGKDVKLLDVGGDHRFVEGWTYGLTELPGARGEIAASSRVANPGCYPAATLLALAPLVAHDLIESEGIVVDAKSGVSGAGRGGSSARGYAETNEDLAPYGALRHVHVPEIREALSRLAHQCGATETRVSLAFTPHLAPMTRGLLSTCYGRPRGRAAPEQILEAALAFYRDEPFIKVIAAHNGWDIHSKWASGSNVAFLSYAVNPDTGVIIAVGAIDNLGKGAAGQAVQNANLMTGQPETAGLTGLPLWP